ncbi:TNF receptor-associated factor 4, partial [Geodia barretti]
RFSPVPYGWIGDRGGYDCKFVEPPPAAFQTDCPICLHVLREPCVISCPCGQKICRQCVEQIKEDDKPCPLCNKTDFTYLRDYGLERSLGEFEVWCSHKKEGCIWTGKLGEYEQHLHQNRSPENQLTGCQFVAVECEHGCGEWFQRHHIASHQNQHCTKRPYSCKYCQKFEATYKYVTTCHYYECDNFPVTCPNKCRKDPFKRHALYKHVKDECPLTEIDCPLHYAGCEVRLPRKDMPEHMTDTATHLTLLATVIQSLLKENHELRKQNELLKDKQNATEKEVEILKETLPMKLMVGGFPVDFHVKYDKDKEKNYSPSFYTHSSGYQMRIQSYPNGCKTGKGTRVSLFTQLMQGPYDDHLKWPFRGEITVLIVNQAGNHCHAKKTFHYDDKIPDASAGRVTNTDKSGG